MIMVVYSWSSLFYSRFDGPFGRVILFVVIFDVFVVVVIFFGSVFVLIVLFASVILDVVVVDVVNLIAICVPVQSPLPC